tara:strand:- start:1692 stop:2276 length:585 start_codon:yes stop_codon:yes gene_type:complete
MQNKIIDEKLILNVIQGSSSHQKEFVLIAEKIIFGALSSFHQFNKEDKDDLLQGIFLKLFKDNMRRISMWNKKASFSTYLYRITTFCALDYLDSKYFKQKLLSNSDVDMNSISLFNKRENPEKVIDSITLDMSLDKLRSIEKEIIELYYKKGYKEKNIADELNISINTVSSIKNRAIKKLRKDIAQEFTISNSL